MFWRMFRNFNTTKHYVNRLLSYCTIVSAKVICCSDFSWITTRRLIYNVCNYFSLFKSINCTKASKRRYPTKISNNKRSNRFILTFVLFDNVSFRNYFGWISNTSRSSSCRRVWSFSTFIFL